MIFWKIYFALIIVDVTSTPVIFLTVSGRLFMISRTSDVILLAPIGPSPVDTMVIFFAWEMGPVTSAATWGSTFSIMSIMAASLYSLNASANQNGYYRK